jgi:hypothetical protein
MERKGKRYMRKWEDIDFDLPIVEATYDKDTGEWERPKDPSFVMPLKVGNTSVA